MLLKLIETSLDIVCATSRIYEVCKFHHLLAKIADTGMFEILFHYTHTMSTERTRDSPTLYIVVIQTAYSSIKAHNIAQIMSSKRLIHARS